MKPIKTNDVNDDQNEVHAIITHLSKFLKAIRKKKVARDLIGNDDRSKDFHTEDFDVFADELSAGVELTYRDIQRITERARKLASRNT